MEIAQPTPPGMLPLKRRGRGASDALLKQGSTGEEQSERRADALLQLLADALPEDISPTGVVLFHRLQNAIIAGTRIPQGAKRGCSAAAPDSDHIAASTSKQKSAKAEKQNSNSRRCHEALAWCKQRKGAQSGWVQACRMQCAHAAWLQQSALGGERGASERLRQFWHSCGVSEHHTAALVARDPLQGHNTNANNATVLEARLAILASALGSRAAARQLLRHYPALIWKQPHRLVGNFVALSQLVTREQAAHLVSQYPVALTVPPAQHRDVLRALGTILGAGHADNALISVPYLVSVSPRSMLDAYCALRDYVRFLDTVL